MKTLLTRLFVFGVCTLIAGTSMAEVARITGRTCKDHLRGADVNNTLIYLMNEFYSNAEDSENFSSAWQIKLGDLEVQDNMHPWISRHIQNVENTIASCEQHCKGLNFVNGRNFKCEEQMSIATANQLHHLLRSEQLLADDAQGDLVEFPEGNIVVISGENSGGNDPTPVTANPASEIVEQSQSNTLDDSYFESEDNAPAIQRVEF